MVFYGLFAWYEDDIEAYYTTDRTKLFEEVTQFLWRYECHPPEHACFIVNSRTYMFNPDDLYHLDCDEDAVMTDPAMVAFAALVDAAVDE